jgi:hypothetical protein
MLRRRLCPTAAQSAPVLCLRAACPVAPHEAARHHCVHGDVSKRGGRRAQFLSALNDALRRVETDPSSVQRLLEREELRRDMRYNRGVARGIDAAMSHIAATAIAQCGRYTAATLAAGAAPPLDGKGSGTKVTRRKSAAKDDGEKDSDRWSPDAIDSLAITCLRASRTHSVVNAEAITAITEYFTARLGTPVAGFRVAPPEKRLAGKFAAKTHMDTTTEMLASRLVLLRRLLTESTAPPNMNARFTSACEEFAIRAVTAGLVSPAPDASTASRDALSSHPRARVIHALGELAPLRPEMVDRLINLVIRQELAEPVGRRVATVAMMSRSGLCDERYVAGTGLTKDFAPAQVASALALQDSPESCSKYLQRLAIDAIAASSSSDEHLHFVLAAGATTEVVSAAARRLLLALPPTAGGFRVVLKL